MPSSLSVRIAILLLPIAAAGCAQSSMVLKGQLQEQQQQQVALARQAQELQQRTQALDRSNQELEALLAQSQQQSKLLNDQVGALREQLRTTTTQLAEAKQGVQSSQEKVQALTASLHRRGGASITPNNSLHQSIPTFSSPGITARPDGDVVRVAIPSHQLFENGAHLRPGAVQTIATVGRELLQAYPEQMLGVEGHTDDSPAARTQWRSNHELSVGQAMVVYDVLVRQCGIPERQLFLVGHGSNHPLASNGTDAGKRQNRRIELVVYPDRRP